MPQETAGGLRWLGVALGHARNWDVFIASSLPGLGGASAPLAKAARELAEQQHVHIHHLLEGARYRALMGELAIWSGERLWRDPGRIQPWDKDARKVAQALVQRGRAKVAKRVRLLNLSRPGTLHRLRIAVKQERYLREFFGAAGRLPVLSDAQDLLGALHDSHVARGLLRTLQDYLPAHAAELAFLEGLLAGRMEHSMSPACRFARRKL